ncbi:MAG: hypothetical protein HYX37_05385 [Rhizobiales bacterium]|nr:hypothetical protein [Hyphomicrobiales bacterium]
MEHQTKKLKTSNSETHVDSKCDLDALLHPARAFAHPMDVVRDADLTLNEKRAILASWASDACALEAAPELRMSPSGNVVRWDDIMDALRTLDREADGYGKPLPHYKRVLAKKRAGLLGIRLRSRDPGEQGRVLN